MVTWNCSSPVNNANSFDKPELPLEPVMGTKMVEVVVKETPTSKTVGIIVVAAVVRVGLPIVPGLTILKLMLNLPVPRITVSEPLKKKS